MELKQVYEYFEKLKPLNNCEKYIFQKCCKSLVEDKKIEECDVEELSKEFLNEDSDSDSDSDSDLIKKNWKKKKNFWKKKKFFWKNLMNIKIRF